MEIFEILTKMCWNRQNQRSSLLNLSRFLVIFSNIPKARRFIMKVHVYVCVCVCVYSEGLSLHFKNFFLSLIHLLWPLQINSFYSKLKMEIEIFQTVTWPQVGHLIKGSCLGASNTMSAPCLLWWCRYVFCRWRYVFYLSRDPTRPLRWDVMRIYGWELLAACRHPEKFGDHRHYDS